MNDKLAYLQHIEKEISEAETALEALKTDYKEAREAAQHEEIEKLEEYLQSARIRTQDLAAATDESWQDLKMLIEEAFHQLREKLANFIKPKS